MWLWLDSRRARWAEWDLRWARALHRVAAWPRCLLVLLAASRLGDGWLWYSVLLLLPIVGGMPGWTCVVQMLAVGTANLLIYRWLKMRTSRPRPYVECPDIHACARALDQFSFPSGHTLHAVAYAVLLTHHYPGFAPLLWIFAALVAASRVILGLHYPSDVVAGAAIGAATAGIALALD